MMLRDSKRCDLWSTGFFYILAISCRASAQLLNCPHRPQDVDDYVFWGNIYDEVARGATAAQRGDFMSARKLVGNAVYVGTDQLALNPKTGFQCSLGIGAAFYVLSLVYCMDSNLDGKVKRRAHQIGLRFLHLANVWITHVWEKFARREEGTRAWYDTGYIDDSIWPITLQSLNQDLTLVQDFLARSGLQGHRPRWHDVPHDFRDRKLKIGIVSLCAYPPGHVLPRYASSNHKMYASRHGYQYNVGTTKLDPSRPAAWGKIRMMHSSMIENPSVDWWLWFDCDTFFMNMSITLDSLLYKYGSRLRVQEHSIGDNHELDEEIHMLVSEDNAMLNTGAFFMRASTWSRDCLEKIWGHQDAVWIHHPWWENAAFLWLLLKDNAVKFWDEDHSSFLKTQGDAIDDMEGIYPSQVRLAPQWEFNSYHPITAQDQHDTWKPGKFAIAFNGVLSGVADSYVMMKTIYGNYYAESCERNSILDQCIDIEETFPWLRHDKPSSAWQGDLARQL